MLYHQNLPLIHWPPSMKYFSIFRVMINTIGISTGNCQTAKRKKKNVLLDVNRTEFELGEVKLNAGF